MPANGATARVADSPRPYQSMFVSDHTTPTVAIGLRSTRYASLSACQRESRSAVRSCRRSSWLAPRWCHHGWMPAAIPQAAHSRASGSGLAALRNIGRVGPR